MGENQLEITTAKFDKETNKEIQISYVFPLDRYYYTGDPGHIWFKPNNSIYEVGFDDFGQQQAGPLLHIRTRPLNKKFKQGSAFGTVESDKWIGPLRLPLTSIILEANSNVLNNPQSVNDKPYEAWVIRIKPLQFEEERISEDIIPKGDYSQLKKFIIAELEKYGEQVI
ncbi:MAG: glycine cleavage system protein H [Candidatus Hodarchaeales archaeon]|jgi:glycine cleavage system H protein